MAITLVYECKIAPSFYTRLAISLTLVSGFITPSVGTKRPSPSGPVYHSTSRLSAFIELNYALQSSSSSKFAAILKEPVLRVQSGISLKTNSSSHKVSLYVFNANSQPNFFTAS